MSREPAVQIQREQGDPEPKPYYVEWHKAGHVNGDAVIVQGIRDWLDHHQRDITNKADVKAAIEDLWGDRVVKFTGRWK